MRQHNSISLYRLLFLFLCAITFFLAIFVSHPDYYGITEESHWYHRLVYHFFHGGILHWLVNTIALLTIVFKTRLLWWYYVVAYVIACVYPFVDDVPIVGMSVWIYVLVGILTPSASNPRLFLLANIVCIAIGIISPMVSAAIVNTLSSDATQLPTIAWGAHLYAYVSGIIFALVFQPIIPKKYEKKSKPA